MHSFSDHSGAQQMDLTKLADGLMKSAMKSADTFSELLKAGFYDMHRRMRRIIGLERKILEQDRKRPPGPPKT